MADELEDAVGTFLSDVKKAHSEYEKGYVDADATLELVMNHVEDLKETYEDEA
ncbi:hypothetical protein [Halogeometricum limi]|uniref:Uncharacterized protein n=1 Tax=Halogeometricum limi TaxID=555875 RepID=A0A1I6IRG2_9EURY|nr:hypothetical protein [Halogeometricum limi]SFR68830.1 hypothetical protein SAMN04488124_3482 [Halogeometricum limi]